MYRQPKEAEFKAYLVSFRKPQRSSYIKEIERQCVRGGCSRLPCVETAFRLPYPFQGKNAHTKNRILPSQSGEKRTCNRTGGLAIFECPKLRGKARYGNTR